MRGNPPVIHDDDLLAYLEQLRELSGVKLCCFSCHEPVLLGTLAAVFPQ